MTGRPARAAKAGISLADRPVACVGCLTANDPDLRFVEVKMPMYPPVDEGSSWLLDGIEPLHLCESCIGSAARTLGLYRDPKLDGDVQRLSAAATVALERLSEAYDDQAEVLERVRVAEAAR